jgi:hypothetical protein
MTEDDRERLLAHLRAVMTAMDQQMGHEIINGDSVIALAETSKDMAHFDRLVDIAIEELTGLKSSSVAARSR